MDAIIGTIARVRGRPLPRPDMVVDPDGEIVVKASGRPLRVPMSDIDCLQVDGKYVVLHVGGARHHVRAVLGSFEERLPASDFARVHRDAIVNLNRITELRRVGTDDFAIVLSSGDEVRLGRRYRSRLPELFGRARSQSA